MRHVATGILLLLIWMLLVFFVALVGAVDPNGPIVLALILGFFVAFLPFPSRRRSLKDAMIATAVYGLFLGGIHLFRDAPIGRYSATYMRIHAGMSLAEAEGVISRELPYRPTLIEGDFENGWVRFGPIDSNYNAEHIDILIYKGHVAEIGPIPD